MEVIYDDGLVIGEGGEILDLPEGCLDKAALLAHRHYDARQNEAAWQKAKQNISRALVHLFPEGIGKVQFGELVATQKTRTTSRVDGNRLLRRLPSDITRNELLLLLSYATGFDLKAIKESEAIREHAPAIEESIIPVSISDPWVETSVPAKTLKQAGITIR